MKRLLVVSVISIIFILGLSSGASAERKPLVPLIVNDSGPDTVVKPVKRHARHTISKKRRASRTIASDDTLPRTVSGKQVTVDFTKSGAADAPQSAQAKPPTEEPSEELKEARDVHAHDQSYDVGGFISIEEDGASQNSTAAKEAPPAKTSKD